MSDIVTLNGYNIKDEKAVRSYESIASMKADTKLKEGYHVKTKGYYEANDGGHGEYVIVDDETLVDDGGSIHTLSNGLRAVLIIDDMVDIKQFGAYGDNIHDDTSYFNFALNKYNKIYLGSGTYLINSTINCNKSNVSIEGNDTTLNINTSGHGLIFKNVNNIEIKNIKFESQSHYNNPSSSNQNNHMIKIYNCNNIRFIENTLNYGCMGLTIGKADNIEIKNNIISNFKGWGLYLGCDDEFSFNLTGIKNCNISENKCFNSNYDGIKLTGYIENINVFNNISYNNARDGIDYAGHTAKNIQIYNNNCYDNEMNGIDFKNLDRQDYPYNNDFTKQFENIHIHDNILYNNKEHTINSQLYYADLNIHNFIIENNLITLRNENTLSTGSGIRVAPLVTNYEEAVIIRGNTIRNSTSTNNYGVRLSNTQNVKVIDNIIRDTFSNCIYVDYFDDLYDNYGAVNDNIEIINNDLKTVTEWVSTIRAGESNVNNLLIRGNKLDNPTNAYLLSLTILNNATNTIIDNEYSHELFDTTPTIRTTKNVIYKSKDPITTGCVGWIGKQNSSEAQYAEYIPITIS